VRQRRDKIGFATPENEWFRGPLRLLIEAGVRNTLDIFPGLFNVGKLDAAVKAALTGSPTTLNPWRLVNFGVWGKVFGMSA
jgi:asparagine synthase (glutamine-hydrolysing)